MLPLQIPQQVNYMTTQQTHTLTRTTLIGTRRLRHTKTLPFRQRADWKAIATPTRRTYVRNRPAALRRVFRGKHGKLQPFTRREKTCNAIHSYVSHAALSLSAASTRSTCLLVEKVVLHFFFHLPEIHVVAKHRRRNASESQGNLTAMATLTGGEQRCSCEGVRSGEKWKLIAFLVVRRCFIK